jgi:hypothetical protein
MASSGDYKSSQLLIYDKVDGVLETKIAAGEASITATNANYTISSTTGKITVKSVDNNNELQVDDLVKTIKMHEKHLQGIESSQIGTGGVVDQINITVAQQVSPVQSDLATLKGTVATMKQGLSALTADVGDVDLAFGQDQVLSTIVKNNKKDIVTVTQSHTQLKQQFDNVFTVADGQPPIDLNKLTEILALYENSTTDSVISRVSDNEKAITTLQTSLNDVLSILNTLTGRPVPPPPPIQ